MLDFKELSKDGNDLELLVREILLTKGYRVQWSGKGPDGGKDLLCFEDRASEFLSDSKTWLIQCKHKDKGAVGKDDLDDIVDSCTEHKAKGYLLVCDTYPSAAVITRLEKISENEKNDIQATYWDSVKIEQLLSTPRLWRIAQRFFPISSRNSAWEIYATESPNKWIANYRGYHFHLSNRIGSKVDFHFHSIDSRINDIEGIKLPKGEFIRIRAVYFNDKVGGYNWFLDYMYDKNLKPSTHGKIIAHKLGDGWALEDGQIYSFDVLTRPYNEFSDHYDRDHYDYYSPYLLNYQNGIERATEFKSETQSWSVELAIDKYREDNRNSIFNDLTKVFKRLACARLLRSANCEIEKLPLFNKLLDWTDLIEKIKLNDDTFFNCKFVFDVVNRESFFKLVTYLPQNISPSFNLINRFICTPDDKFEGSIIDFEEKEIFEIVISLMPEVTHNIYDGRKELNSYMNKIIAATERFISENE
ncbi:restriction endonuclease [Pedobacter sp. SYSU D00535]|uniref:restriction endonuclease n=1 Tax=Pedobacter sp. SYSU D00535 TaxID=2810308 RepID=UPI001A977D09|nr:restriction endonuclease [Pedobacter sp. SYSU D00535]